MPKINETFVKGVSAPNRPNKLYYDEDLKGFALRVTKAGAKAFVLNYSIHGRERRQTIGGYPGWSAKAAREEAKSLRRQVDRGIDPLEVRNERQNAPTVSDLWEEYSTVHLPNLAERTQKDQKSMWRNDVLPSLASVRLVDLSSHQIDTLHRKISLRAPYTANRTIEYLRSALNLAIRRGWMNKNPANGFRKNKETPRERYLLEDQMSTILECLDKMANRGAANAIRLLILTGARRTEVFSAEWSEFDLVSGIWTKPAYKVKARRESRLPISPAAVVLLLSMQEVSQSGYLFPSRSGAPIQDIKKPWAWLRNESELPDIRIHDLRHSFASMLVSNGETLETIGKLLGHSQHQTTMRYAHLMDNPLRKAANKMAELIKR